MDDLRVGTTHVLSSLVLQIAKFNHSIVCLNTDDAGKLNPKRDPQLEGKALRGILPGGKGLFLRLTPGDGGDACTV